MCHWIKICICTHKYEWNWNRHLCHNSYFFLSIWQQPWLTGKSISQNTWPLEVIFMIPVCNISSNKCGILNGQTIQIINLIILVPAKQLLSNLWYHFVCVFELHVRWRIINFFFFYLFNSVEFFEDLFYNSILACGWRMTGQELQ